jgi:hypothetical protein
VCTFVVLQVNSIFFLHHYLYLSVKEIAKFFNKVTSCWHLICDGMLTRKNGAGCGQFPSLKASLVQLQWKLKV